MPCTGVGAWYSFTPLNCNENVPLKHSISKKFHSNNYAFPLYLSAGCYVCFLSGPVIQLLFVYFVGNKRINSHISAYTGLLLSRLLVDLSFFWLTFIFVQFTLSNSSFSQSGISTSAGPFPYTIKKLHDNTVSLCLIVTLKCLTAVCFNYYRWVLLKPYSG